MLKAIFKDLKPSLQLYLFIFFWVLFFLVFTLISQFLIEDVFQLASISPELSQSSINKYKFVQLLSSVGIFVLPPLLLMGLFFEQPWSFLKTNGRVSLHTFVLVFLILFFSLPILNLLIEWNEGLGLPESWSGAELFFRELEDEARSLTESFLKGTGIEVLLLNLFLVAVIPAIGEELLFRGVLQQYGMKILKNPHIAIWVTACWFSLLHFQFFGFIPRMVLGALFGYLFFWSGSIWVPIFAHFVNNATAVIVNYYAAGNDLQEKIDAIGTSNDSWYYSIPSAVLLFFMIRFFRREHSIPSDQALSAKE